jgi:hypothetical protein
LSDKLDFSFTQPASVEISEDRDITKLGWGHKEERRIKLGLRRGEDEGVKIQSIVFLLGQVKIYILLYGQIRPC